MKLQYLCHLTTSFAATVMFGFTATCTAGDAAVADAPVHSYPTVARVEFVNECMGKLGGKLAALYQCSCVIDRIANVLGYDDYVEASTFAKYATLPGEGGGEFRDSDRARALTKSYRQLESDSLRSCGIGS